MIRRNILALLSGVSIIIIIFIIIFSIFHGNPQIQDQKTKPIVMSAQQFSEEIETDSNETSRHIYLNFESLKDGDEVTINDTIDYVTYRSDLDITSIEFNVDTTLPSGEHVTAITFDFMGNVTDSYEKNDAVKITCTIKHVSFTYNGWTYDCEVYGEGWNQTYYVTHSLTQLLPLTCILHSN